MSDYGINIGSRRSRSVITPSFSRDFVTNKTLNHGIGPDITFTRASSATFFTSTGILSTVPDNVPRFDHGSFRTNHIRNSTMVGAVVGAIGNGGAFPTTWTQSGHNNNGMTTTILGTGTENGLPYIDFNLSGTPTTSTPAFYNFQTATQIPATLSQTWTQSFYIKLIDGSTTNATFAGVIGARNSGGVVISSPGNAPSPSVAFTPTTTYQRISSTITYTNSAVAYVFGDFRINYTFNQPVNVSVRLAAPQTELSAVATAFIPTTNAPVTTGVSLGLLIEESRTNFVPTNNVFNWGYNSEIVSVSGGTGFAGISSYIISDTSDSFRDAAYTVFLSPLLTATPYTISCYIKKDFTADNLYPLLRIRDSANNYYGMFFNQASGTWIEGKSGPDSLQTFITKASVVDLNTHWRFWYTFSSPVTSQPTQFQIYPAHSNTATVTGNIEVAGIQIEQGLYPTSYITTAGTSATRLADDARISSINTNSFFNQEQGTVFMEAEYVNGRLGAPASPGWWTIDTGAFAVGYGLLYGGAPQLNFYTRSGGGDTITNINTFPNNTPNLTRTACTISPTQRTMFYNGNFAGTNTTPYAFSPLTTFRIGANYIAGNPPINFFGGYIRKITYWPTRLSSNRLRLLTF